MQHKKSITFRDGVKTHFKNSQQEEVEQIQIHHHKACFPKHSLPALNMWIWKAWHAFWFIYKSHLSQTFIKFTYFKMISFLQGICKKLSNWIVKGMGFQMSVRSCQNVVTRVLPGILWIWKMFDSTSCQTHVQWGIKTLKQKSQRKRFNSEWKAHQHCGPCTTCSQLEFNYFLVWCYSLQIKVSTTIISYLKIRSCIKNLLCNECN